jgi:hypothetical protein
MARSRLGQAPGSGAAAQPGWAAEPQAGWAAEPQAGPLPGSGGWRGGSSFPSDPGGDSLSRSGDIAGALGDDIAGAALGAASRFIGRAMSRRVQEKLSQQVLPAMAVKQEAMLRAQIAIAERHPGLRACLADHVIFLAGGSRVLPMPNIATVTVEQSDALVASLRDG